MNPAHESIPTRRSLLSRLKDWNDQDSWKVFFDTYWKLIYNTAVRAGLTDSEAQDVVQETVLSVSKSMRGNQFDPTKGSFKHWLLRLTRWRVASQMRRRLQRRAPTQTRRNSIATATQTEAIERIADPDSLKFQELWEEEWEHNLMEAAIERVKRRVDPKQYQLFDLNVVKGWPVSRVAHALQVNRGQVYLAKHRVSGLIKKEIARLRAKPV